MINSTDEINPLSLSLEFSHLISNIAEKEMEFFAVNNIEILHDFRVDIRKLRTWLQIFVMAGYRVKKIQKHLVRCHKMGDELRNFDVLLHWMKKNSSLISSESIHSVKDKRKKLKKLFIKELINQNVIQKLRILGRDFLPQLAGIEKNDFQPYTERYIDEKNQKVYQLLPNAADDLNQLHEIRKLLKKVRYALHLMPILDAEKIDTLREFQDILGYINDRRVWIDLLQSKVSMIKESPALEKSFQEEIDEKLNEFRAYIASNHQTKFKN